MSIREDLAKNCYEAWDRKMSSLSLVEHRRCKYRDASDNEKDYYRVEADRILKIIEEHIPKSNSDWRWE